jgi:hypothetical protein
LLALGKMTELLYQTQFELMNQVVNVKLWLSKLIRLVCDPSIFTLLHPQIRYQDRS